MLRCRQVAEAHVRRVDVILLHVAHDAGERLLHLRMARHPHIAPDDAGCTHGSSDLSAQHSRCGKFITGYMFFCRPDTYVAYNADDVHIVWSTPQHMIIARKRDTHLSSGRRGSP